MGIRNFEVITIGENTAFRTAVIAGNVDSNATDWLTESGLVPKYIYVTVGLGAAGNQISCGVGHIGSGVPFAAGFKFWAEAPEPVIFNFHGFNRVSFNQLAGGDGLSQGWVVPLEDF